MKRFYKTVLILVALLISNSSAWAETQAIFSVNAYYNSANHYYNVARDNGSCGNPDNNPFNTDQTWWISTNNDLGLVTSSELYINGIIWLDYTDKRNNGFLRCWVDNGGTTDKSFGSGDGDTWLSSWCGCSTWRKYSSPGYQIVTNNYSAGDHYAKFVARCPWYNDDKWFNNGGSSNYYALKFTIPGFTNYSSTSTFNDVLYGTTSSANTITYSHYGTSHTTTNFTYTIDNYTHTGTAAGSFSVTSISNSQVRFTFTAPNAIGTTTARLTITDAHGKTAVINLTGHSVAEYETTVTIGDEPEVSDGPNVELSGYLKYNGCDNTLFKRGFFICEGASCNVTSSSKKVEIAGETTLKAKETFAKKFYKTDDNSPLVLEPEHTYRYRAYVYSEVNSSYILSEETGSFTTQKACQFAESDTIYYTIDNSQAEDPCELRFRSLANAIADMKKAHKALDNSTIPAWINGSGFITKPIVAEVVYGTYGNADNTTREECLKNINGFSAAYSTPGSTPDYRLVVRAKDAKKKPTFKGGFDMMQSRYITLKDLKITRETSTSSHWGSAVELGYYYPDNDKDRDSKANLCDAGVFTNTDIEFIGCEIEATAFNCIHAVGCNGLVFEECVFDMEGVSTATNDRNWGASVKLMSCKNVQFTRNNMRGSHATTLFLQHTQNMLIMNNVFWNDNLFKTNVAFIRPLVLNSGDTRNITNLGIYYNTFYLEDQCTKPLKEGESCTPSSYKVDFLRFGGPANASTNQFENRPSYITSNINFKWNNCYSYDDDISSKSDSAFTSVAIDNGNYRYNNFWSKGDAYPEDDETESGLAFGTDTKHVDVEDEVCKSSASDPDDLVFKGSLLNIGPKPSTDISGLNVANNTNADRFTALARSEAGGDWTYGAFQQANIEELETIIWNGGNSSAWDDRGNWVTPSGRKVNCANVFSSNLRVIIPDAENLKNVPLIPEWAGSRGTYASEEGVAAGMRGNLSAVSKFASHVTIEEGGAITGVENLYGDGTLRYNGAENSLTVMTRKDWVLVGGVIKKFKNGESGDIREIISEDFYIADHKPHVYMQKFVRKDNTIIPGTPFTSLKEEVATNSAFGIYIPDQYGPLKLPASRYYSRYEKNPEMVDDGDKPKTFEFKGRFANEAARPIYNIAAANTWYFVNNSYPANLNISKLLYDNSGLQAKYYDYEGKSWEDGVASNIPAGAVYIKPNNGFVLYASTAKGDIQTTLEQYGGGSTAYYKSASVDSYIRLRVINSADATASSLNIRYESESLPKAFSYNASTPEIYVPDGDNKYSTYGVDDFAKIIPLSIRNKQASGNLTVQFKLLAVEGFESVILEDRLQGKTYDLMEESPFFSGIAPGDCAGRFYLNINYADNEPIVPTDVKDEADYSGNGSIDIYSVDGSDVVISSSESVAIETVYVTDMAGRTKVVKPNDAHYSRLTLDGASGVYVIKAVGDSMSKTEKVIIK